MMIINFDKYDPDTIIDARPLAWCNKFEKPKSVKEDISKELISVVWHPKRWWHWCFSEDEKKEIEQIFIDKH